MQDNVSEACITMPNGAWRDITHPNVRFRKKDLKPGYYLAVTLHHQYSYTVMSADMIPLGWIDSYQDGGVSAGFVPHPYGKCRAESPSPNSPHVVSGCDEIAEMWGPSFRADMCVNICE